MTAEKKPNYGRTWSDLIAEILQNRPIAIVLLIFLFVLCAGVWFALKNDYVSVSLNQVQATKIADPTAESPFVYWYQKPTSITFEECKALVLDTHTTFGSDLLEVGDFDTNYFAQVSVKGAITSVMLCSVASNNIVLQVFAAGPDSSQVKNRAGQLFQYADAHLSKKH